MQSLQCKVCQKVTMADGASVWVCKECGAQNLPDANLQADVPAAASQMTTPPAAPTAPVRTPPVDPNKPAE